MKTSAVAACALSALLLLCCGCHTNQPPASSAVESVTSVQSEPASAASADPSSSNPSPASSQAGPSRNYEIGWGHFDQDQIHIDYPVLSGLADADLQNKINDLIYKDIYAKKVESVQKNYADEPDILKKLILDTTFRITLKTDDLLSIVYTGTGAISDGMHPSVSLNAITIDMHTGEQLFLSDFVTVDEALVQRIKQADTVWASIDGDPDPGRLIGLIQENDDYILRGLTERWTRYDFFLTPHSLAISLGIVHAAGDYAVVELQR